MLKLDFLSYFIFMYMGILTACVCTTCFGISCYQGLEKTVKSPGSTVTSGCELPWWCWDLNMDPMEEQP